MEKNYGTGLDKELSILKNVDGAILDTRGKEDVLVQIGNLSRKPSSVLKVINDSIINELLGQKISEIPEKKKENLQKSEKISENNSHEIIIGKERNIPYKIANCCSPTNSDKKIIGIIGHGQVTIHKFNCENVANTELGRRIPAQWERWNNEKNRITITMEVIFDDKT